MSPLPAHRRKQAMPTNVTAELAAVAHRIWCDRMLADGWRYADRYSETERTHDALVPFDRLDRRDQRAARLGIVAEELEPRLASAIRYSRGPNREFLVEEMLQGRRVVFCPHMRSPAPEQVTGADIGTVESWDVDDDGELDLIRVRWPDGQVVEHAPGLLELARLEELK